RAKPEAAMLELFGQPLDALFENGAFDLQSQIAHPPGHELLIGQVGPGIIGSAAANRADAAALLRRFSVGSLAGTHGGRHLGGTSSGWLTGALNRGAAGRRI